MTGNETRQGLVSSTAALARGLLSLAQPLAEHHVNEHTPSLGRATVLSGFSMAVSLVTIPLKLLSGPLADTFGLFTTVATLEVVLLVGASLLGSATDWKS